MYVERMEQFFIVNSVGEDKKVAVLLNSIGPETYRVLSDLLYPVKPKEKNFKRVSGLFTKPFFTARFKNSGKIQINEKNLKRK